MFFRLYTSSDSQRNPFRNNSHRCECYEVKSGSAYSTHVLAKDPGDPDSDEVTVEHSHIELRNSFIQNRFVKRPYESP